MLRMSTRPDRTGDDLFLDRPTVLPADGTKAYARLRRDVAGAGLLDRSYRYYMIVITIIVVGLAASLVQVVRLPVSVTLVVWSLGFSFFAAQLCGIIHDAGHRAIADSTKNNNLIGEICSDFLAMGFTWWRLQHNIHHAHTNEEEEDPDLDLPLHAFTLARFHSQRGVWRYLRRYQALTFYPLRVLVVFSRRLSSVKYFQTQPFGMRLTGEMALWSLSMFCWFGVPFLIFPLTKALVLFVVIHTSMGFYLSNVFAPNHKGMPQLKQGTEISFLEQQIRTSRNITPSWATDVIYMGLNYQIEHHLFPTCPRNKLKHIRPYVMAICHELNLKYTEVGIVESNRIIVGELRRIATKAG